MPEKAEEQFSEVFETYKSPHNSPFIISRRTYSPFESFENVNKQDFIVLCIDVSKTLRLGDEDGEYNAFLWKAKAKFGSNGMFSNTPKNQLTKNNNTQTQNIKQIMPSCIVAFKSFLKFQL